MAQTGYTPISIYYSATTTNVPTAGNLVAGELAINTNDGKLFYKDSSGVVQTMASKDATAGTYSSITTNTLTIGTTQLGAGNASIMKNRIINGAMVIDQRNAGASVTPASSAYTLDRWQAVLNVASKFSVQQSSTTATGFSKSLLATSTSAYSIGASEYCLLQQAIEGFNIADLGWGTANAKTVTLSFQVRSSLTGTFGGVIANSNFSRCYPFTYTISSANTYEFKTVTITGDTSGTWNTTNGIGFSMFWDLGVGSTYSSTSNNAWTTVGSNYFGVTGVTKLGQTNGATFYITGVQLEVGSSATGFEYVNYQTSLANCYRYFQRLGSLSGGYTVFGSGRGGGGTTVVCYFKYTTPVRATPTISQSNTAINYPTQSAVTGFGSIYYGTDSAGVELTNANIVLNGTALVWLGNNNSSAYVDISAEL